MARTRVAYQGEPGAFSEEAALRLAGAECELVPCPSFAAVAAALAQGQAERAVLPLENAIAGPVAEVQRGMAAGAWRIERELTLPIEMCLLTRPEARWRAIREAASHAVALAQCGRYLAANGIRAVAADDTAGSVRAMMAPGSGWPPERAVIAGPRAAERYGAWVRARGIADRKDNRTRFGLLAPPPEPRLV